MAASQDQADERPSYSDAQGTYECDIWGNGPEAAESAASWDKCKKNPGHPDFIPITKFSLEHLPKYYRHPVMVDFVKLSAALTVRLKVMYTSSERPEGYPFWEYGGTKLTTTGTGHVLVIGIDPQIRPCPCPECQVDQNSPTKAENSKIETNDNPPDGGLACEVASLKPHNAFWELKIRTAKHVVFDTSEASNTEVEFFFDSGVTAGSGKTMYGLYVVADDYESDQCEFLCVTHDKKLVDEVRGKLNKHTGLMQTLVKDLSMLNGGDSTDYQDGHHATDTKECMISSELSTLNDKVNTDYHDGHHVTKTKKYMRQETVDRPVTESTNLCFIISHPHGRAKRLTIGNWLNRKEKRHIDSASVMARYGYSTDTCDGSSGSAVFLFGRGIHEGMYTMPGIICLSHRKVRDDGINISTSWFEWKPESYGLSD